MGNILSEVDASKIPVEWYSWMHSISNRIEKNHDLKKFDWQKPHQQNFTGTDKAYHPNKQKKDAIEKNIKVGRFNYFFLKLILISILLFSFNSYSNEALQGKNIDLKILDKISSKNELIKLKNGEELIYKDLSIKSMKCTNSEFDDNPEIKAYIQVRDLTKGQE